MQSWILTSRMRLEHEGYVTGDAWWQRKDNSGGLQVPWQFCISAPPWYVLKILAQSHTILGLPRC